ncbi:TIGR01841 family phasin [Denitrificimonas caeni]|uniref:TIGR01841 family phasin n=1 Tax=Denitrificimonas caeni TaxID=521720 RepID=UPI001964CC32|nr:TIGR01841 family phasin [Denitrificimonas caeni]
MSLFNSEKIQNAQKAQLEMLQQISSRVFESVEQLTQLQLKSLRAASGEQFESLQSMLTITDPKDLASLQTALPQPAAQAERLMEFNREVYELISKTQADIAKLAESQVDATSQQTQELIETLSKNAPAGAEPAVAMFKTALETVGSTYDSVQKAAKQASEMAEEGIAAAASAAGKATATATAATESPKAAAKK